MEKLNCLIVEDEPLAAEVLVDYTRQVPFLECKGVCSDGIFAMQVMQKEEVHVIFLDIHLPKLKGLDFVRTLKKPPQVIITTAYREYALEGYELNVVDYLLKPIQFSRFLTAVNKIRPGHVVAGSAAELPSFHASGREHLLININKKRAVVYLDEILYFESRKEYIKIVTSEKSLLTKFAIGEMEVRLPADKFTRVHRSFIVAKEKITAFSADEIEIANIKIPIGRSYRNELLRKLKIRE
jgi:DNA-binding LytR/AlgR family response regulator